MKEIKITSSGIKQAIDDLVNENELLQDKVYKQEDEIKRIKSIICEVRYKLLIITSRTNITGDLFDELLELAHLLGVDKE